MSNLCPCLVDVDAVTFMRADGPSVPDPPGQSTVRVLRGADGVALTNEPDPDRLAFDRRFDGPGAGLSLNSEAVARGISCVLAGAKGFGFVVLGLGAMILIGTMIGTIFFDVPMKFGNRMVVGREALGIQAGFLVFWAAFGACGCSVPASTCRRPRGSGGWRWATGSGCCGPAIPGRCWFGWTLGTSKGCRSTGGEGWSQRWSTGGIGS